MLTRITLALSLLVASAFTAPAEPALSARGDRAALQNPYFNEATANSCSWLFGEGAGKSHANRCLQFLMASNLVICWGDGEGVEVYCTKSTYPWKAQQNNVYCEDTKKGWSEEPLDNQNGNIWGANTGIEWHSKK
ncbi:hypothetical protein HK097_003564 [Rhizophlyctis rosea]|uniref:Uncharacterized protein n=1 Tax=Rhizophlyctis rosea TaxID=64517 RepID=A0AAD5SFW6_9FUNG|nr:hypothetical protein HK097_003564 [Rhizophlyctis rosea]